MPAAGVVCGGQRDCRHRDADGVEQPVDRMQFRFARLASWRIGSESARFHGGGEFRSTSDGYDEQAECLREDAFDGAAVAEATRAA